ncbi:MAG: DJ-1/PfpI/YhbO family deglycase/protease [Candidatus Eisenbacteria bacterium]|nr:DJ-1/PfpI/YhbO family deglycase/protease [Candidatus Eisenbacteria bacterium]
MRDGGRGFRRPVEAASIDAGLGAQEQKEDCLELKGKRIAVLAEDLYEDIELWYPMMRMREAGAEVSVLGAGKGKSGYKGKHGLPISTDGSTDEASADDYDAVIIPGGYSPDRMRRHSSLIEFVKTLHDRGAVVAWICHGGWVPVSAGVVEGRKVTSFFSIRDDMENAGATWLDEEVVRDGNLVSSRYPDDLPAFCRTIIDALAESD